MRFRAEGIEGLRGVAALAVVVSHTATFMLLPGATEQEATGAGGPGSVGFALLSVFAALGVHGVTIFFVISGFLLYRPFVQQVANGEQTLMVREFLRNRLLRIFPGYLVIFSIAAFGLGAVVTQVASDTDGDYIGRMTDPLLIITNLTLTQGYLPQGQLTGLGASWSLVPELAFYFLLPLIWMVSRRLSRRMSWLMAVLVPVAVMMAIGFAMRLVIGASMVASGDGEDLINASTWSSVVWRSILTQGDLFAMGMVVAVISVHISRVAEGRGRDRVIAKVTRWAWWLLIAGLVLAIPAKLFHLDAVAIGLLAAGFIWVIAFGKGWLARAGRGFLEWKPVDRAGEISYSIYLWHVPVIYVLQTHFPALRYDSVGNFLVAFALVVVLTWILSEITYRLVEKPMLDRKRSMIRREPAPAQNL